MRVMLVYPPVTISGRGKVGTHLPMGILYLASYLENRNHQVSIVDALSEGINNVKKVGKNKTRFGLSNREIIKRVKKFKPDLVGISVMFTAFARDAVDVANLIKKYDKRISVVAGGAHVSIDPKNFLGNKSIDYVISGEGEVVLGNLVDNFYKKTNLRNVRGLAYRQSGKIMQNRRQSLVKDLDVLPFPALDKINLKIYDHPENAFQMRHLLAPMVTSRGCPNHCVYCSIHSVWEHSWRGRSAENVVAEMEWLKTLGVKEICFQDDSMSVNKTRMNKICDLMIEKKLNLKWTTPNGIAHWTLDKPLIRKMKKAGCYRITFGIESGNPAVRRWVGKPFSLEQARELTKYANRVGMWTLATNIIGFPYETREEIEDTVNYAMNSDVDFALFFRLGPRPGTPVFEIFKKEGWLPKDVDLLYSEEVACETKYFKGNELFEIQTDAYRRFLKKRMINFLNPMRIFRKIKNLEDMVYVGKMGWAGLQMAKRLVFEKAGVTSKAFRV